MQAACLEDLFLSCKVWGWAGDKTPLFPQTDIRLLPHQAGKKEENLAEMRGRCAGREPGQVYAGPNHA